MISTLQLQNFKCFTDATLPFAPLTLLAGANATGKSTTIQALLLLRQSHLRNAFERGELLLNGALTSIGTTRDAFNQSPTNNAMIFVVSDREGRSGRFSFVFDPEHRDDYLLRSNDGPHYAPEMNLFLQIQRVYDVDRQNAKHKPKAMHNGGVEISGMDLNREKAQEALNQAIEMADEDRLFAWYEGALYVFFEHTPLHYHGYRVDNPYEYQHRDANIFNGLCLIGWLKR